MIPHDFSRNRQWRAVRYLLAVMIAAMLPGALSARAAESDPAAPVLAMAARAEQKAHLLADKLKGCRAAGQDIALPDGALAVAELFCRFTRSDAAKPELRAAAQRSLAYVEQMLDAELAKADAVLTGKATYPAIPQWRTVGVKARAGGLWCGDEPAFLSGFCWDSGMADRDPALLRRLGANLADGMVRGTIRADGSFRDDWFRSGPGAFLDRMATAGFAVDSLLDANPPRWMIDATTEMVQPGYGHYIKYVFEHPKAAAYRQQFLDHFMPLFATKPAQFAVDLDNEPAYQGPSALMLEHWRGWLRKKYGDLDGLNRAWGTSLESFEAIKSYPSMGDPAKGPWNRAKVDFNQPGVRASHYDWCAFNNERVSDYFRSEAECIHAHAPGVAVHVKVMMGLYFTGSNEARGWPINMTYHTFGVDPEAINSFCDLLGCDLGLNDLGNDPKPGRFSGSVPYVIDWLNAGLSADFLKSLAPDKPFYNSEFHAVERVDETDARPSAKEHIETALWLAHLHGMNANLLWYWGRGTGGEVAGHGAQWFKGSLLQQPWVMRGYVQESLNLRRFVRPVMAFASQPRPVRLLYSEASAIQDVHYLDALRDAYEALNFLGVGIGLVTERQLAAGLPEGTRLVIVPNAGYVEEATVAALQAARARGVAVGVIGGQSLGATPLGQPRAAAKVAGAETIALGTPQEYQMKFDAWLKAAGVERELIALDAAGRPAWGVEVRTALEGGRKLAYLVNLLREPVTVRLHWRTAGKLRDWRGETTLGAEMTLRPRQVVFGACE